MSEGLVLAADGFALAFGTALRWTGVLAGVWLVSRLPALSAAARHRLWFFLLLSLSVLPVAARWVPALEVGIPAMVAGTGSGIFASVASKPTVETPAADGWGAEARAIASSTDAGLQAPPARPADATGETGSPPDSESIASLPANEAPQPGMGALHIILGALWFVGMTVLFVWYALGQLAIRRLAGSSRSATRAEARAFDDAVEQLGGGVRAELLLSHRERMPIVGGVLRPFVLLPEAALGWEEGRLRRVLLHELAHVRRRDIAALALGRLVCAVFWFHPGVWLALRTMRREAELACDDDVLAAEGSALDYADDLIHLSRTLGWRPLEAAALPMARPGELPDRIRSLLAPGRSRGISRSATLGVGLAVGLLVLLSAGVRWAQAGPPDRRDWLESGEERSTGTLWTMDCGTDQERLCRDATEGAATLLEKTTRTGVVIAQEVQTGEIITYASLAPTGASRGDAIPLATPGSVAKLALAALWWESEDADERIACPDSAYLPSGRALENPHGADLGQIDVSTMLVVSCNSAALAMAERLVEKLGEEYPRALRHLGFPAPFADEARADDEPFWDILSSAGWPEPPAPWFEAGPGGYRDDLLLASVGIAGGRTTPLHVSRFLQAVGNRGILIPPVPFGGAAEPAGSTRILSESTTNRLREAMDRVVQEGTAVRTVPQLEWSDWSLGGKTGTVDRPDGDGNDAWFAGLISDDTGTPRYTIVVLIENGGMGGGLPAGVAAEMTRLFARINGSEL